MAGAALLIVGNYNATSTFSGSLQDGTATGGLSLAKVGSGTLTLNGASTFSAGTTINAGTVQAGNDSALGTGNLTLAGAPDLQWHNGLFPSPTRWYSAAARLWGIR